MTPPNVLDQTKAQLSKILKSPGCRRSPVFVEDMRDVVELSQTFVKDRLCPIFMLSNVTGSSPAPSLLWNRSNSDHFLLLLSYR